MKDNDERKRIVLIWERKPEDADSDQEEGPTGDILAAALPLGDAEAPVLRVVSSGFGQTVRLAERAAPSDCRPAAIPMQPRCQAA